MGVAADRQRPDRPLRLFVAIAIPDEVRVGVYKAQQELRGILGKNARWTPPEQFHVTLKFLGNVAGAQVEPLIEALKTAVAPFPPMELSAAGLGAFPKSRPPRVVWVGVRNAIGQLSALHWAVEQAAASFTTEPAAEEFHAHVTLARVKEISRASGAALRKWLAGDMEFGSWKMDRLHLTRSDLSSEGARHSTVAELLLGGCSPPNPMG